MHNIAESLFHEREKIKISKTQLQIFFIEVQFLFIKIFLHILSKTFYDSERHLKQRFRRFWIINWPHATHGSMVTKSVQFWAIHHGEH